MLESLSPESRIWIFQSTRRLSEFEENLIKERLDQFIPQWAAHGNELYGEYTLENGHFLIVGVDESKAPPSGCSIDKLVHTVQELGKEIEMDFMNRLNIAYELEGAINLVSMEDFKAMIRAGEVNSETIVFNNLVPTKAELKTSWRTQVVNSWHKNLLEIA